MDDDGEARDSGNEAEGAEATEEEEERGGVGEEEGEEGGEEEEEVEPVPGAGQVGVRVGPDTAQTLRAIHLFEEEEG